MTNQQGVPEALRTITRYEVVDCIDSKHVPAVIPNKDGPWVRYEDHVAALVEAQQPTPSAAAAKPECYRWERYDKWVNGWGWGDCESEHDPRLPENKQYHSEDFNDPEEVRNFRALYRNAPQPSPTPHADSQPAPVNAWQQAIDHELVTAHLGVAGAATFEEARKALHELIAWNVEVATNPATNGGKVLVDAARAPADSVTAPAGSEEPAGRTDVEIVEQTEELATFLLGWAFNHEPGPDAPAMRDSTHPFALRAWSAACHIQDMLTQTDVQNALAELEDAPESDRLAAAPTPPAQAADSVLEDADPLQGAANWLAEAHGQFGVSVLQGCLMIGYTRAKRLHDAAIAARKQVGAT